MATRAPAWKHVNRFVRRIFYNHFVRDFHLGSLLLVLGLFIGTLGATYGGYHWHRALVSGIPATSGTVMLAALPVLVGIHFMLTFVNTDIASMPTRPVHPLLKLLRAVEN